MEEKEDSIEGIRRQILSAAKPLVREHGWFGLDMAELAARARLDKAEVRLAFPRGGIDIAAFHVAQGDKQLEAYRGDLPQSMREKIAHLIWLRLEIAGEEREIAHASVACFALPPYSVEGLRYLGRSCDLIWRLAGDRAIDMSYYTKRATLAVIFTQALIFYLSPAGEDEEQVKRFMAKEIGVLMLVARWFSFARSA